VREDMHIALCYYSQLPGNFNFFRRNTYINTRKTASFASLHNAPSGRIENIWGKAITIFRRSDGAPHFFNLHNNANNGHTMIVGPADSAKGVLANFLMSESSKYDPQILSLNQFGTSRVVVKALGGEHSIIDPANQSFARNPFTIEDTPENQEFLRNLLLLIAFPDGQYTEEQKNIVFDALEQLIATEHYSSRKISKLLNFITNDDIKNTISLWCGDNKFATLFDHDYDAFDFGVKIVGFDVGYLINKEYDASIAPFMLYSLHKFTHILDGSPAIIVINDANLLLSNPIFESFLPKWLDHLTANNALAIFVCDTTNSFNNNLKLINDKIATHLFLPHSSPKDYQEALKLTDEETKIIKEIKLLYRNFMIKQGHRCIVVELNLDGLDYVIRTLEGKKNAVEAMEQAIKTNGENPNSWIIPFYKNLFPELDT